MNTAQVEENDWDIIDKEDAIIETFNNNDAILKQKIVELIDSDEPTSDEESFQQQHEEADIEFDLNFCSDNSERELFPACVYWKQYHSSSGKSLVIDTSKETDNENSDSYESESESEMSVTPVKKETKKKMSTRETLNFCTGCFIAFLFFCYFWGDD